jgi:xanthine dehydrogenase accessory factor
MICSGKQTVLFTLLRPEDLERVQYAMDGVVERQGGVLSITGEGFTAGHPICGIEKDITFSRESENEFSYTERLGAKNDLYIVGGGHCALALSELMSKMDFHVTLFDDRPQLNTIEKNKFANEINVIDSYEHIGGHIDSNNRAFVVVMTLGYKSDKVVIRELINKDFKYFGVLGSEAKMATLFREMIEAGFPKKRLDLIHTPIGLPINSHSPEEIAVSIAAEIIAVKNKAKI